MAVTPELVSACCITYGRPRLLEEAIECFLRQDYAGPTELIILNTMPEQILTMDLGCCPDPDKRVHVINYGIRPATLGDCRNICIRFSHGDWIFPGWDDDNIYYPEFIRKHVEGLQRLPIVPDAIRLRSEYMMEKFKILDRINTSANHTFVRRKFWEENPYPSMNSGEDQAFRNRMRTEVNVPNFEPYSSGYGWDNGVHHVSGQNDYDLIPERWGSKQETGEIRLEPKWNSDYLADREAFTAKRNAVC
jgi:glycosyltransferase involved in cell wall biosynthesis